MNENNKKAIITGSAGFIGFHMAIKLLEEGWKVTGIDNFNAYYDLDLKNKRSKILKNNPFFSEIIGSIENKNFIKEIINKVKPKIFIHLAAQAGVRYSMENPNVYIQSNILGTFEIIEALKSYKIDHFMVASTSSVYGNFDSIPFNESSNTDAPISFYASTKKAMEVLTHNYSHLYQIPTTIFRFFTVYGPWGRPDMALFKFTKAILENKPIQIYNNGNMKRDFTYISDLIESIYKLIPFVPEDVFFRTKKLQNDTVSQFAPWRVINIGNSTPVNLLTFIDILENCLQKKALKEFLPYQKGEVLKTWADNNLLQSLIGYKPNTNLKVGIEKFIKWYLEFYK